MDERSTYTVTNGMLRARLLGYVLRILVALAILFVLALTLGYAFSFGFAQCLKAFGVVTAIILVFALEGVGRSLKELKNDRVSLQGPFLQISSEPGRVDLRRCRLVDVKKHRDEVVQIKVLTPSRGVLFLEHLSRMKELLADLIARGVASEPVSDREEDSTLDS
jgi:hypothetical protein